MRNKRLVIALLAAISFGAVALISVKQYLAKADPGRERELEVLRDQFAELKTEFDKNASDFERQLNDLIVNLPLYSRLLPQPMRAKS